MYNLNFTPATPPEIMTIPLYFGPNDGVSRGDRADTGDEEAAPDEMGSGYAHSTGDPTSSGAADSIRYPSGSDTDPAEDSLGDEGMQIRPADDRSLGLTNTDTVPADDWAADTGGTRNPDSRHQI